MSGTMNAGASEASTDWLAIAVKTAHVALGVVRLAGGAFVEVNPAFLRLFGYSREEIVGRTSLELGLWLDTEQRHRLARWLERGGTVTGFETQLRTKRKDVIDVSISARIVRVRGERHFVGFFTDTTELKRAQAALRGASERLREAFAASQTLAFHQDTQLRYTWVANPALGVCEADIVGKTDADILGAQAAAPLIAVKRLALDSGQPVRREVFVDRQGKTGWFELFVQPERGTDGVISGILCVATDITARKVAGRDPALSALKLDALLNTLDQAAFITDASGQVLEFNPAFARLHGFEGKAHPPRLLGEYGVLLELRTLDGREVPVAQWPIARALRGESGRDAQYLVRRRDTNASWVGVFNFSPLKDVDGRVLGAIGTARDITDVTDLQAAADRTVPMPVPRRSLASSANTATPRSPVLTNISHELRTPLNVIAGMAALLRQDPLTVRQHDRLNKLEAAGAHLLKIVEDLLDIAQIESGALTLTPAAFRVEDVVGQTVAAVYASAAAKGLELASDISAMPTRLTGDARRIGQALLNYAANAIKFTTAGGVRLRAYAVEQSEEHAVVRFEVIDSGPGIAPAIQQRLFAPFEQADNSIRRRYGGTGLGLAITRHLAVQMGGEAGVDSAEGMGSTFWFTVRLARHGDPREIPLAPGERPERQLRLLCAGARVLVIDDDADTRAMLCDLLHFAGLIAQQAADGAQALSMIKTNEPGAYQLILMDIHMPSIDGLETARRIRQVPSGRDVPIVACTADADPHLPAACAAAGINEIVAKPLDMDRLYARLLVWLRPAPPVD